LNVPSSNTPQPLGPQHASSARFGPGSTWEEFARKDPYSYILTSVRGGDTGEFWRSGERTVQMELLPLLQFYDVRAVRALELGCGIGRLVVPLSRHFKEVIGVDIAQSMVRRATSYAVDNGVRNISFRTIHGPVDLISERSYDGTCDFVYSLLVFQHISDFWMIDGYLNAVATLLQQNGLAYLQFDTRPHSPAYRLKTLLPDFLLPRFWRRGIRRIRRTPDELEFAMRSAGLEIVGELGSHTAYHRYILRRARRSETK
jgi:SAM-dependent methyltransferase